MAVAVAVSVSFVDGGGEGPFKRGVATPKAHAFHPTRHSLSRHSNVGHMPTTEPRDVGPVPLDQPASGGSHAGSLKTARMRWTG